MVSEPDVTLIRLPSVASEFMSQSAMPSLSDSRTVSTAQIYGAEWGLNPRVYTLDHQI